MNTITRKYGWPAAASVLAFALLCSSLANAGAEEFLVDLYNALGGSQWIESEGWLEPDNDWCDWYGVECTYGAEGDPERFSLDLSGNNLRGSITAELQTHLSGIELDSLDLSNNLIRGQLYALPFFRRSLDLSDNLLEGELPEATGIPANTSNTRRHVRLARNSFSGAVPDSWQDLQLTLLDLSDNRLDSGVENAFSAMSRYSSGSLYLTGNAFSGELSSRIFSARLNKRDSNDAGGGLDICFNDLAATNSDVNNWIAARHAGSDDYQSCQGVKRQPVTPAVSGSWFDPDRPGEGISLLLMDNGAPLLYRFGFNSQGSQQWLFEVGHTEDVWLRWDKLHETAGFFGQGMIHDDDHQPLIRSTGHMRIDYLANNDLSVFQQIQDMAACDAEWSRKNSPPPPGLCLLPLFENRAEFVRLTGLTGTSSCDNLNSLRRYSGAWFSPEHSGEGFMLEVMDNNDALVYWFTYQPEETAAAEELVGAQAWMMGLGKIKSLPAIGDAAPARVEVELVQPIGGSAGNSFNPEDIELADWGQLTLELNHDSGQAAWTSDFVEYGQGEYDIERLARPMLAECD